VIGVAADATVPALLERAAAALEEAGIETARPEAEWLLAGLLGVERFALYLEPTRRLTATEAAHYRELIERRARREPLQYLLGWEDFHGLRLAVTPDVLVPRPETEALVERALAVLRRKGGAPSLVLDVGTGSGAIAVTLAVEVPSARIVATDVSLGALRTARENARRHGVSDRVRFACSDADSALKCGGQFAVVVSNPPYVAEGEWPLLPTEVRDHEPPGALLAGRDGLSVLRPLIAGAAGLLSPGGEFWCEIGASQGETVSSLPCGSLRPLGVFPDLAGRGRYVGWKKPERER